MHTTSLTPATGSQVSGAGAEALVDLGAIADNVRILREHAGSAQVMAVVKADAYGHGAPQVARAAVAAGAAELGVATIDEALALRRGGITAPVLSSAICQTWPLVIVILSFGHQPLNVPAMPVSMSLGGSLRALSAVAGAAATAAAGIAS